MNDRRAWWRNGAVGLGLLASAGPSWGVSTNDVLSLWLAAQTNLVTWQASFVQTRTLRALAEPLRSEGRLWFQAPRQFRWELGPVGQPPQTIALRQPEAVWVVSPRLLRAERYPLNGVAAGPWKEAMALLDAGFPRSRAELDERFKVVGLQERDGAYELRLQPRAAAARRLMREIGLTFRLPGPPLAWTELVLADGSVLRNDFRDGVVNEPLTNTLFEPNLGPEYRVLEPARNEARP